MSHYTVTFTGNRESKESQAREATRDYLSPSKYDYIVSEVSSKADGWRNAAKNVRFVCSMLGIGGYYPFRALLRDVLSAMREQ